MSSERWLVVGVDTEEEGTWGYDKLLGGGPQMGVRNIEALPRLHAILDPLDVRPCYLMDYPVVSDPAAAGLIAELHQAGRCDIGTHLHAWVNPPYDEASERRPGASYAHNLPRALERAKLVALTEAIERGFGERPVVYRGGRYGFDGESLGLLEELGYTVDSTVTPMAFFSERGAPDFLGAPRAPYHPDVDDVRRRGASPVLEVPITMDVLPPFPRALGRWLLRAPKVLRMGSILNRVGWVTWLRPSYATVSAMLRLVRHWEAEGLPVLNMMFHSSELLPGGSPYTPDADAVKKMLEAMEAVLRCVIERGWRPCRFRDLPERVGGS